jgi:exodeoxyribonuclease-1
MSLSLYWHDYETFGQNPRSSGIAQFAGIRTDLHLNEIGDPQMFYCQPPQDSWPDPVACLITGITPQHCRENGLPEYRFAQEVSRVLSLPGTCGVGFNNIRFDDEFTRQLLYRNFYDPYEREWKGGNSRWDLIDVLRFACALRPEGINWPKDNDGHYSMKLEKLTAANGVEQVGAHDALVDVRATIGMARLLKREQPKLYDYAFSLRDKKIVAQQIDWHRHRPFLHTSSMFGAVNLFTTLVMPIMVHPTNKNEIVVFDLKQNPARLIALSSDDIRLQMFTATKDLPEGVDRLALKTLHMNKSPMLATMGLLNEAVEARLGLDRVLCESHWQQLLHQLSAVQDKLNAVFNQPYESKIADAEFRLYDGFIPDADKYLQLAVRRATVQDLTQKTFAFHDERLRELLFRYRARNFPQSLSAAEQKQWQAFRQTRLHTKITTEWLTHTDYFSKIIELEAEYAAEPNKLALLQVLKKWLPE